MKRPFLHWFYKSTGIRDTAEQGDGRRQRSRHEKGNQANASVHEDYAADGRRYADMIWLVQPDLDALNALHEETAVAHLGIEVTEIGADYLQGRMPVDKRTMQPFGLLHGGASALLLETLASAAANHCVPEGNMCVGLEINCNHLRGVGRGWVTGQARALRIGRSSMVWDLKAWDEDAQMVTVGRLTSSVVPQSDRRS